MSGYALGKRADVHPSVIGRFPSGQTALRGETIDRLAAALGLRLVANRTRRGPTALAAEPAAEPTAPDG